MWGKIKGNKNATCFGQPRECVVLTLIFVASMILKVYLLHKATIAGLIVESCLIYVLVLTSNMYDIYGRKPRMTPTCIGKTTFVQSFTWIVSTFIFVTSMILTVYLTHKATIVVLIVESFLLYILGFTSKMYHIYYTMVPTRSVSIQTTGISTQNSSSSGRPRHIISFTHALQALNSAPPPPYEIPMSEMSRILPPGTSQTTDSSTGQSIPSSQAYVFSARKEWLLRTCMGTCMGWCLRASYKEHPKATAIAYAGGASSAFLANFLVNRHASQHGSKMLLRAGGFLSVAGISWGMHVAIDEHPKAAIKACVAGALSVCLAKSLILSDPPATVTKTIRNVNSNECELYNACVDFPVKIQDQIKQIGRELKKLSKEYQSSKYDEWLNKLLTYPLNYYVSRK